MHDLWLCIPKGTGPEFGKASPWALFFVIVVFAALMILLVSMNKHMKNIPKYFPPTDEVEIPLSEDTSHDTNG